MDFRGPAAEHFGHGLGTSLGSVGCAGQGARCPRGDEPRSAKIRSRYFSTFAKTAGEMGPAAEPLADRDLSPRGGSLFKPRFRRGRVALVPLTAFGIGLALGP